MLERISAGKPEHITGSGCCVCGPDLISPVSHDHAVQALCCSSANAKPVTTRGPVTLPVAAAELLPVYCHIPCRIAPRLEPAITGCLHTGKRCPAGTLARRRASLPSIGRGGGKHVVRNGVNLLHTSPLSLTPAMHVAVPPNKS